MALPKTVSLTSYDEQLAAAQRRQKLSEMLQEQANAPIDIQSYKGVQAPIPLAAVLAKALQGYAAENEGTKADKQKANAEQSGRQQALSDYRAAAANRLTANGEAFTPAGSNVPNPQFSAQKPSMLANILGGGNAQPPPAAPILPQAAPMPQGAPMAAPPIVPVSQAPLPAANPAVGVNMPQMAQAMPVAPPGPVGPVRKAVDFQSKAPTARELEDSSLEMLSSSNPYARSFGQNMFERSQTQLDEQRKLDLIRKEKMLDREEDVNRATSVVSSIPGLSPDQREFLSFQAKALGTEGLKSSLEQMSKNQFGEHYKAASPEELEGYPKGTVGQVSTTTGKLSSVYNPTADLNSTAQVKISQANLGINQARLTLEGKKFDIEQAAKDNAILKPEVIDQLAYQALTGDKSVFQNLGRGQQGAQNIVAIRSAINRIGTASGKSPQEIGSAMADANANYVGRTAEQRIVGARSGASTFANAEMPQAVNLSKEAYSKLPRGQFVPFNKLRSLVDKNFSSVEQGIAYTYDEDAIASYARALNPTGIARKSDIEKGEKLLNGATSIEAHNAVLDAMQRVVTQRQAAGSSLLRPPSGGGGAPAGGGSPTTGFTVTVRPR